jgi:outer membrane protein TolC
LIFLNQTECHAVEGHGFVSGFQPFPVWHFHGRRLFPAVGLRPEDLLINMNGLKNSFCFSCRGAAIALAIITAFGAGPKLLAQEAAKPPAPVRKPLTLVECYQLAVQRSEALGITAEELKIAEARYWQAVSSVLPQVDLIGTLRTQNNAGGSSISSGTSGFSSEGGGSRRDRWEGRLRVSQTIFSGFRDFNLAGAAKAQIRSQNALLARQHQTLFLDVSDLFHQLASLEKDYAVVLDLNETLRQRWSELNDRVKVGRSRKGDLLAAETELAESDSTLEELSGLIGATRELLAYVIGVPADRYEVVAATAVPEARKLEDYLWKSGERADITAAAEASVTAKRGTAAAYGAFTPTISGEFNWLALEDPERDQEWNILITAELPLFDGGLRAAQVKESKAAFRQSQLNLSQVRRQAESDVRVAYNNFQSTARQFIRLQKAVDSAYQNYETQKHDYDLGRTSNLDVLAALTQYHELQRRLAGVQTQTSANMVALMIAAGQTPVTGVSLGTEAAP